MKPKNFGHIPAAGKTGGSPHPQISLIPPRFLRLRITIVVVLLLMTLLVGGGIGLVFGVGLLVLPYNGLAGLYRVFIQWDFEVFPPENPINIYVFIGVNILACLIGWIICVIVWRWGIVRFGLLTWKERMEFEEALNKWGLLGVWKKVPKGNQCF